MHLLIGERELSLLSMIPRARNVAERGKKDGRNVKIKRNTVQTLGVVQVGSEKEGGRRTRAREGIARIRARVSNILFLLALAKLIENEDATRTSHPLLLFSPFFHPPIKFGTYERGGPAAAATDAAAPSISDREKSRQKGANRIAEFIYVLFHSEHGYFDREDIGVAYVPPTNVPRCQI